MCRPGLLKILKKNILYPFQNLTTEIDADFKRYIFGLANPEYSPVVGMGPQVGLSLSHMGETARHIVRTSLEPGVVACVGVESSRVKR